MATKKSKTNSKKPEQLLKKMRNDLEKKSVFFKDLSFGKEIISNDVTAHCESTKYAGLCFWLDQLYKENQKKVNRYCFAFEISENLRNRDIADNLPSIWWVDDANKLDNDFFEQILFEYDVNVNKNIFDLEESDKNGFVSDESKIEILKNHEFDKGNDEGRYICFYLTIGSEEKSLEEFEKQFENFNLAWKKIMNHDIIKQTAELLKSNHNIILHGAPGTGKTFLAKEIAKKIIFPNKTEDELKSGLSTEEQKQFNQQCGFVQFHQSYDYTDFVEGLRPKNEGNGNVGFEHKDGIFKTFCENAIRNKDVAKEDALIENAIKSFKSEIRENGTKGVTISSVKSGRSFTVVLKNNSFKVKTTRNNLIPLTPSEIKKYIKGEKPNKHETYGPGVGDYILKKYIKLYKPFIFIIDEINRGEMSKIFGELFFSIDPGYRGVNGSIRTQYANLQDKPNEFDKALSITEDEKNKDNYGRFFVPKNVYIIGTMNDIDRSVESMDFAMRRRFAFKEIEASDRVAMLEELGNNEIAQKAKNRMKNLNVAIENIPGLSRAYHIGPAYFLKLNNYNGDFEQLWTNHIKGLLTEYLRGMDNVKSKIDDLKKAFDNENAIESNKPKE